MSALGFSPKAIQQLEVQRYWAISTCRVFSRNLHIHFWVCPQSTSIIEYFSFWMRGLHNQYELTGTKYKSSFWLRNPRTCQHQLSQPCQGRIQCFATPLVQYTVGPLVIESLWAKKIVSTGALGALDDPLVVQTKI